ncbi:hypothetical protein NL676_026958 [Syzygium grande]|nr:hypothetical protein NL676_026958 [Syzygium grande]
MSEDKVNMIILASTNYAIWRCKMEDHLYIKGLQRPIKTRMPPKGMVKTLASAPKSTKTGEEGEESPKAMILASEKEEEEDKWTILNKRCVGTIRRWLDQSIFENFVQEDNAYDLWKNLERT